MDATDAVPSSAPQNELLGQDQRVAQVPSGSLVAAPAFCRARFDVLVLHFYRDANSSHLILESQRSRRGADQSFREGLRGDP